MPTDPATPANTPNVAVLLATRVPEAELATGKSSKSAEESRAPAENASGRVDAAAAVVSPPRPPPPPPLSPAEASPTSGPTEAKTAAAHDLELLSLPETREDIVAAAPPTNAARAADRATAAPRPPPAPLPPPLPDQEAAASCIARQRHPAAAATAAGGGAPPRLKKDEESPPPPPLSPAPCAAAFVGKKLLPPSALEALAKAEADATGAARCDAKPSAPKLLRALRRRRALSWNAETARAAAGPPTSAEVAAATSAAPSAAATSTEKGEEEARAAPPPPPPPPRRRN